MKCFNINFVLCFSFAIKSYNRTISTGNLIRHLADSHGIREEVTKKVAENNLTNFFAVRPKNPSMKETDKKWLFGRHLVLMICRDLMPFTIVENEGFRDFLKKYNVIKDEAADLPVRMTLSRAALEDVFVSMKSYIIEKYLSSAINDCCFTFDMWTDNYRHRNYICFTLHFIDHDFQLKSITLANKLVIGKHTAEKILFHLDIVKDEFNLRNKNNYIVSDSAANMRKAAKISNTENHLCSGHALHNLVVVDGVKKNSIVSDLIGKTREIVKTLKYKFSDLEKEINIEQQKVLLAIDNASEYLEMEDNDPLSLNEFNDLDKNEESYSQSYELNQNRLKTPKLDVPTRWHSSLLMLESINYNRSAINTLLGRLGKDNVKLSISEWETIGELVRFLKKIEKIVEILSSEKICTINLVLLFRSELKMHLNSNENDSLVIKLMKNRMLDNFDHRFPMTDLLVIASLLDPRFQNLDTVKEYLDSCDTNPYKFLKQYADEHAEKENTKTDNDGIQYRKQTDSNSKFILDLVNKHSSYLDPMQNDLEKECHILFSKHSLFKNILDFWKEKQHDMPVLSKLAKKVLCIPATSTPSERVFSIAGLLINNKRSSVCPSTVNKVIFVHDNYELCKAVVS